MIKPGRNRIPFTVDGRLKAISQIVKSNTIEFDIDNDLFNTRYEKRIMLL